MIFFFKIIKWFYSIFYWVRGGLIQSGQTYGNYSTHYYYLPFFQYIVVFKSHYQVVDISDDLFAKVFDFFKIENALNLVDSLIIRF